MLLICSMQSSDSKAHLSTQFTIPASGIGDLNSPIFFAGSCFSEHIAGMLGALGFQSISNPFGILYNPMSLATAMEKIATEYEYSSHDFVFQQGEFHSMHHHGSFKAQDAESLAKRINEQNQAAHQFISEVSVAIITLGTAKVWQLREPSMVVGNCHKIPDHEFSTRLLTEHEIKVSLAKCVQYLSMINPGIKVMFTISPVKHLREGISANLISKSRLISAVASFREEHPGVSYFPAYEIMTEELRDHRFYAEDLAHPSQWSIHYIFRRFCETCFDGKTLKYMEDALAFNRMKNHRVLSKNEEEQQQWKNKCDSALEKLMENYPEKTFWPAGWR